MAPSSVEVKGSCCSLEAQTEDGHHVPHHSVGSCCPRQSCRRTTYNIAADLPEPLPPPLHPGDPRANRAGRPGAALPDGADQQEVSADPLIEIPEEVREAYRIYRPSPLHPGDGLEKALDTPARIYYKYEGVARPARHKPNTAIAQAFYNRAEGVTRLVTETGAGQWGSALAFAGSLFGLETKVFMVKRQLRAEAVPAQLHRDLGSHRHPVAVEPRRTPGARSWPRIRNPRAASASPSARRSRRRPAARTPSTRSAACSTTCCCTRP